MNYRFVILKNEEENSHYHWERACKIFGVDYTIIDLTKNNWYEKIKSIKKISCILHSPTGEITRFKNLFDERLYILSEVLHYMIYPSFKESYIYENKKLLSYFLKAKKVPHPETKVFYYKSEAISFLKRSKFPIVSKTSIGASGTGVKILKNKQDAINYINKAFSRKGIKREFGPNRKTGNVSKLIKKSLSNIPGMIKRLRYYFDVYRDSQRDFVIFQEYIPHSFEWRVVNIGGSFFAHKKIKIGDMASGSKGIDYVNPPKELLDFAKKICEEEMFSSMAIDIFEDHEGNYLVNELQTIFGHVQKHILEVDGKIGRYVNKKNKWIFEEGDFNKNVSFNLRLGNVIDFIKTKNKINKL